MNDMSKFMVFKVITMNIKIIIIAIKFQLNFNDIYYNIIIKLKFLLKKRL